MKLSAITSRATLKDYVDLYFILKRVSLAELLALCTIKYPTLDQALILKSLVYFEDITAEPISFVAGFEVSLLEIKDYLVATVKEYWDK